MRWLRMRSLTKTVGGPKRKSAPTRMGDASRACAVADLGWAPVAGRVNAFCVAVLSQ
jgi:hypothetical protein